MLNTAVNSQGFAMCDVMSCGPSAAVKPLMASLGYLQRPFGHRARGDDVMVDVEYGC